jgi:hypothetical protein
VGEEIKCKKDTVGFRFSLVNFENRRQRWKINQWKPPTVFLIFFSLPFLPSLHFFHPSGRMDVERSRWQRKRKMSWPSDPSVKRFGVQRTQVQPNVTEGKARKITTLFPVFSFFIFGFYGALSFPSREYSFYQFMVRIFLDFRFLFIENKIHIIRK